MKSHVLTVLLCGATFVIGFALGSNRTKPLPAPTQSVAPAEESSVQRRQPLETGASKTRPQEPAAAPAEAAQLPMATPPPENGTSNAPAQPTAFTQALDVLLSPQATFQQKQAAWKQLLDGGQLDHAIESLKEGAAQNPTSAAYQAALGQAQLKKTGVLSRSGAGLNEMGIVAMQADQSFDAALKIDPSNWDAQFYKAVAMSHWPAELNKSGEVVQMLSRLIDQQETRSPQPEFAQTYVVLGEQYLKMNQAEYAQQTWRMGLQKFPAYPALLKKVAGQ